MARMARLLLTVAFLGGILALPTARAQAPDPLPASAAPAPVIRPNFVELLGDLPAPLPDSAAPAPERGWEPEFLRSLPRPPDQPRSLFQPAPPLGPPPPDLERPYFQLDPILDPPQWPQPGWFAGVQIGLIHPHVEYRQSDTTTDVVTTKSGRQVNVALQSARLNWTVAPRFVVGYRLPSGFGEFYVADRFFSTGGTGPTIGPDGPARLTSRLSVNYTDFDYASREYTPLANWGMKWLAGLRLAYTDTDSRFNEPFAQAAAGKGVFAAQQHSYTVGFGPHYGLELDRRFAQTGFSFVMKVDDAYVFSRINQVFSAATTTLTPAGQPESGVLTFKGKHDEISILSMQVGLAWQPSRYPNARLFLGYVYEAWWDTQEIVNQASRGMFENQGVVFQAGLNF